MYVPELRFSKRLIGYVLLLVSDHYPYPSRSVYNLWHIQDFITQVAHAR